MSCHLLSQFLHGEQGALMTAAALTHAVPDYEGKLYAEAEIPVWEDASRLEALEDVQTGVADPGAVRPQPPEHKGPNPQADPGLPGKGMLCCHR